MQKDLLSLILQAGGIAQNEILKHWKTALSVEWKADSTPVTIADKKTEELVRNFAQKETPEFGFIGEEFGGEKPDAEYQWVLDPIDGTKSFIYGVPLFGTLIAILRNGTPIAGLIQLPALNSKVWATEGGGAFADDGRAVKVSDTSELKNSLVLSGTINTIESKGYGEWFAGIRKNAKLYRGWGDCFGYCQVACGRAEIMIDPVVSLWDIAPYPLIFAEAGGAFSTLKGEKSLFSAKGEALHPIYEGYTAIASNGRFSIPLPVI
ncbi:histidinol phosphate phosphatase [Fibrobacteria bacterium R8-3-H12]